ncbi:MAG: hypothetical protein DRN14_02740 [Thermoplasmata archaeon]|nr:MAG: hypothetical protein DRN14_02740 [Thermoplasmata archaeon]
MRKNWRKNNFTRRDMCLELLAGKYGLPLDEGLFWTRLPRLVYAEIELMGSKTEAELTFRKGRLVWTEKIQAENGETFEFLIETHQNYPNSVPRVFIRPGLSLNGRRCRDGSVWLCSRDEYVGKMSVYDLRQKAIDFLSEYLANQY